VRHRERTNAKMKPMVCRSERRRSVLEEMISNIKNATENVWDVKCADG
jgi:hypothetical protein